MTQNESMYLIGGFLLAVQLFLLVVAVVGLTSLIRQRRAHNKVMREKLKHLDKP